MFVDSVDLIVGYSSGERHGEDLREGVESPLVSKTSRRICTEPIKKFSVCYIRFPNYFIFVSDGQ